MAQGGNGPRRAAAAHWSETPLRRVIRPIQQFIHESAASGIVLFAATVVALILANVPLFSDAYDHLLHVEIGVTVGSFHLEESVLHWVNDGLMAIFFLLVGLEIKRELLVGELSSRRLATLPIVAATGGAVVPALIYLVLNPAGAAQSGWGIPMATDIAFALGVLALLGSRIPFSIKVFLTAVAIVDDLIAVLVIAIFYTADLNWIALAIGVMVLLLMAGINLLGFRKLTYFMIPAVVVWLAFLESGVHATIAGVLVALTIPSRYRIDEPTFLDRAYQLLERFRASTYEPTMMLTGEGQQSAILALEAEIENIQAPLQKLEHKLHTPVNFLIMPIFALANAGVILSLDGLGGDGMGVVLGIIAGLVIGKPIGLFAASYLAIRMGWADLPTGAGWSHILGAGVLAGIGFTMSLFIGTLAFGEGSELLDSAKLAILFASLIAGGVGYLILSRTPVQPARAVEGEHESSTPVPAAD